MTLPPVAQDGTATGVRQQPQADGAPLPVARVAPVANDGLTVERPVRLAANEVESLRLPTPSGRGAVAQVAPAPAEQRLEAVVVSARARQLGDAFRASDRDAVKMALQGLPRADQMAVISAFNRDPANRPALGVRNDFEARVVRVGLYRDPDFQALLRHATGRNDDVARLHRAIGTSGIDNATVLQIYRSRSSEEIRALETAYDAQHGGSIAETLTRGFGDLFATQWQVARRGTDQRRPEHDTAARLIDLARQGDGPTVMARELGEALAAGRLDAVRRAVAELAPGRTLDELAGRGRPASVNQILAAAQTRIDAALSGNRDAYVAASVLGIVRRAVDPPDALRALGMIDGTNVTWANVSRLAQRGIDPPIADALRATARDPQVRALVDLVIAGQTPGAANGADDPRVRAEAVRDAIDGGWSLTQDRRRAALTSLLEGLPPGQREAVNQAFRERYGHDVPAALAARFDGLSRERALADWAGPLTPVQALYFASRGYATTGELARAVSGLDLGERTALAQRFARERGESFTTTLERLRSENGEAARVFQAMLAAGQLSTLEGRERLHRDVVQWMTDNRGAPGPLNVSRFLTDQFHYSGPQLDGATRELLYSIQQAKTNARPGEVPAELRAAHAAFVRDYARYLRDKGETAEAAAAVAGAAAMIVVTAGFGLGAVPATLVGAGTTLATRVRLDPAYADTVPNRAVEIAGSATAQVGTAMFGGALVARAVPATAFSRTTLGSNGANLLAGRAVNGAVTTGAEAAIGELPSLARVGAQTTGVYLARKAPWQVEPGLRMLNGVYVNDIGQVQPWRAYYDGLGRMIGRTDYNARNTAAGIPETHYHRYIYTRGGNRLEIESHIEGEFPASLWGLH